ncbi:ferrous iron transport protein B [candidate division KSB1 bacterium]|nr:ferrous iron transport protein B [candidate division KSB1 bacterium]
MDKVQQSKSDRITPYNVALVGNPNCGKTTLFNALTGLRQKVANYPGVTVERKSGELADAWGNKYKLIDLPGLYSLTPRSLDEKIASDIVQGKSPHESPVDLIIVAADASNLGRGLYLCSQVCETGTPTILVLNMMDIVERRGMTIDVQALSERLKIPVIPAVAKKNIGVKEIRDTLSNVLKQSPQKNTGVIPDKPEVEKEAAQGHAAIHARYDAIDAILNEVIKYSSNADESISDKIDRVLTHKIWGPLIMFLVLSTIFQAVYSWAAAPMEYIENSVTAAGELIRQSIPAGMLRDLLVDGVIAGVGAVLVFLPQILLLFLFISILEDSGYLSRVAFILDRVMAHIGLTGQSVIPLLSSFACAVPGIMAARTIHNTRDRLITILIAPFMSCSARLPVYTLMIGAFIPSIWFGGIFYLPAFTLLCMYILGIVASVLSAALLGKFIMKGQKSNFIMELPHYRVPIWRFVFLRVYEAGWAFVQNAGKIILAISIILWALASYPKPDHPDNSKNFIHQTYAGCIGHFIEPAIRPLGFDWKIGVGLITSFAAREVMVSTLGTLYNVQDADETSISLRQAMKRDRHSDSGKPVYTPLSAISLMVFFVLACQCMSTLAIIRRETNTWRWPIFLFIYMLVLAYGASFVVYQTGLLLGFV